MTQDSWWGALYDDVVADVLLERGDEAEVDRTIGFLIDVLELRRGDLVFDQCSGIGGLAVPLAKRGFRVVGVEQAAHYAHRTNVEARAVGVDCHVVTGDAFQFVPDGPCRGAFNWWTSFGYEQDDRANRRMLERAFDALEPGGRFALDTMNAHGVLRNFQERVELTRTTRRGTVALVRTSQVDLRAGMLLKVWAFALHDGTRIEKASAVRLYAPHELLRLLTEAGFREIRFFGNTRADPLDLDSPRCICLGRKP